MKHISLAELDPRRNPIELIRAIGLVSDEQKGELRDQLFRLCHHRDPDVREEALRLLTVKWRDVGAHSEALDALREDPSDGVRANAAYGVAATVTDATRREGVNRLLHVLLDEQEDLEVRAAAYDGLLLIYGRPNFPSMKRDFDPAADVQWDWIREIQQRTQHAP
jgi:hypothetical protein